MWIWSLFRGLYPIFQQAEKPSDILRSLLTVCIALPASPLERL